MTPFEKWCLKMDYHQYGDFIVTEEQKRHTIIEANVGDLLEIYHDDRSMIPWFSRKKDSVVFATHFEWLAQAKREPISTKTDCMSPFDEWLKECFEVKAKIVFVRKDDGREYDRDALHKWFLMNEERREDDSI